MKYYIYILAIIYAFLFTNFTNFSRIQKQHEQLLLIGDLFIMCTSLYILYIWTATI